MTRQAQSRKTVEQLSITAGWVKKQHTNQQPNGEGKSTPTERERGREQKQIDRQRERERERERERDQKEIDTEREGDPVRNNNNEKGGKQLRGEIEREKSILSIDASKFCNEQ